MCLGMFIIMNTYRFKTIFLFILILALLIPKTTLVDVSEYENQHRSLPPWGNGNLQPNHPQNEEWGKRVNNQMLLYFIILS